MFVCYVIMLIISCTANLHLCIDSKKNSPIVEKLLTSFGAKNGVTFRENKALFLVKRTLAFFFEESGSQRRALGPMSTV